jgi:hypothetical protein
MAQKTVNLKLVADYIPAPDPPEANAEIKLEYSSYTVSEGLVQQVKILRSIRTDQVTDVDWAAVNVSVLPVSGSARFAEGATEVIVSVTAQQVDTNEQGTFELSNPRTVSGPVSDPILISPSWAYFMVNDTSVPGEITYLSDFETGAIQAREEIHDGWIRQTMDEKYPGQGFEYSDNVVASDVTEGVTITPRDGNYMVRLEVRDGDNPLSDPTLNPRSQLLQSDDFPDGVLIPYGVIGWTQWSVFIPVQSNVPSYSEIQSQWNIVPTYTDSNHMLIMSRRHGVPSDVAPITPNCMRMAGYYWGIDPADGVFKRLQIASQVGEFGYNNDFPVWYGEWMDWRVEVREHETNGRCVVWYRRPTVDNVWHQVMEYDGPLGFPPSRDGTQRPLRLSQSSYGGGNFPRILYFDEHRITYTGVGTIDDVDIPSAGSNEPKYVSAFESGQVFDDVPVNPDGWAIQSMQYDCPRPSGEYGIYCIPGTDYSYTDQVLTYVNDNLVGPVIARGGDYFYRLELRHGDNPLDGDHSPRTSIKMLRELTQGHMDFNVKSWAAWSMYHPAARCEPEWNEDVTIMQFAFYPDPGGQGSIPLITSQIALQFEYVPIWKANIRGIDSGYKLNFKAWDTSGPQSTWTEYWVSHADLGNSNTIPAFFDEWVDWRIEIKPHLTSGIVKMWYRRPSVDNVWVQWVDIAGIPVGALDHSYLFSLSLYGGPNDYLPTDTSPGAIAEQAKFDPPLLLYLDEIRIQDELTGIITDVDPPPLSSSVTPANPNATPEAVALLQTITDCPKPPRQIFSGHHVASFHSANDVPNAWDDTFEPGGYIYELNQLWFMLAYPVPRNGAGMIPTKLILSNCLRPAQANTTAGVKCWTSMPWAMTVRQDSNNFTTPGCRLFIDRSMSSTGQITGGAITTQP